jgi:hypothetical protein
MMHSYPVMVEEYTQVSAPLAIFLSIFENAILASDARGQEGYHMVQTPIPMQESPHHQRHARFSFFQNPPRPSQRIQNTLYPHTPRIFPPQHIRP